MIGSSSGAIPPAFAELLRTTPPEHALRRGDEKFLVRRGQPLLFDLASDPGERRNLARERSERAAKLAAEVRALSALLEGQAVAEGGEAGGEVGLSAEQREVLKSLGYLD